MTINYKLDPPEDPEELERYTEEKSQELWDHLMSKKEFRERTLALWGRLGYNVKEREEALSKR